MNPDPQICSESTFLTQLSSSPPTSHFVYHNIRGISQVIAKYFLSHRHKEICSTVHNIVIPREVSLKRSLKTSW